MSVHTSKADWPSTPLRGSEPSANDNYIDADELFASAKADLAALDQALVEDLQNRHRIIMRAFLVSTALSAILMALFFKVMP